MIFKKEVAMKFLLLVLLWTKYDPKYVAGEVRCLEREREALVRFKQALIDDYAILSSWSIKRDCCKWEGVVCSNTTGHVMALNLRGDRSRDGSHLGGEISPALLDLHHLKDLDIGGNDFGGGRIPSFIGSMKQLQHLNLNESSFSGVVPPQLGNLTNLRTIDLSSNSLRFESLDWLASLSYLQLLDLSDSDLSNVSDWLQQVMKLRSLQVLYLPNSSIRDVRPVSENFVANSSTSSLSIINLSHNQLTSSVFDWLFNISSRLIFLDLSFNLVQCPIPNAFGQQINLELLGLSFNMFTNEIPKSLGNLSRLQSLSLSNNQLTGPVPESLGQLSNLQYFDVSYNFLRGTITEANFIKLEELYWLDLSNNPMLKMSISPAWNPPFQLDLISLTGLRLGPGFPPWIRTQTDFTWLDLSSAGICGELPQWLTEFSSPVVEYLNLSYNRISGTLPDFSSKSISIIDLESNMLQGPLPLFHPSTWFCQLSNNMFSGSIFSICNVSYSKLELLDLSSNQLSGDLPDPDCWGKMGALQVLSLANNNFTGEIPHGFGALSDLRSLHLFNNSFSGELPSNLKNCRFLEMFDVGENEVTGNIQPWIGTNYRYMTHLSFRRNRFHGGIPQEICQLVHIQMLDLSSNILSGEIPDCFNNFTSLSEKNGISAENSDVHNFVIDYALVQWKGQELKHYGKNLRLLKLIDLSSNRLVGSIPASFYCLKGLISLNLSRNILTGKISSDISQMEMLEILDLARNQLSGQIPFGLAQLHFLAFLDLANNNFSGKIPSGTQLQSFNASVYAGNAHLCGLPLVPCSPSIIERDDSSITLSYMSGVCISMAFGFIVGFWGFVGSLVMKKSWRIAYFNLLAAIWDWLYVMAVLSFAKFRWS